MSWIAGHLLLYKEKQDTKEEEILNKKVNRISVTKKKTGRNYMDCWAALPTQREAKYCHF